jgi:hypothetical protein
MTLKNSIKEAKERGKLALLGSCIVGFNELFNEVSGLAKQRAGLSTGGDTSMSNEEEVAHAGATFKGGVDKLTTLFFDLLKGAVILDKISDGNGNYLVSICKHH